MSYNAGKVSNYTGSNVIFDVNKLNSYLGNIDNDLKTLFMLASPIYQFGSGDQYEYLQSQGDSTWSWASVIGGWNITVDTLYAGTGSSFIGLRPAVGIWLGAEAILDAPFSIDPAGVLHAHSGLIDGLMKVGSSTAPYVLIDGTNKQISSSDYVSGQLGSGWAVTTELAEFQNIRARGKLVGATFEKDTISSVGGNFLVCDSDILDEDM